MDDGVVLAAISEPIVETMGSRSADGRFLLSFKLSYNEGGPANLIVTRTDDGKVMVDRGDLLVLLQYDGSRPMKEHELLASKRLGKALDDRDMG